MEELLGPQSKSNKMSSENLFRPPRDDGPNNNSMGKMCKLDLPKTRLRSKLELNSPSEIKFIEENVRINTVLANLRYSLSSESVESDDIDKLQYVVESDDDLNFTRITSEYPLMINAVRSPSDGSLIAVIDFDISDDFPECSHHIFDYGT